MKNKKRGNKVGIGSLVWLVVGSDLHQKQVVGMTKAGRWKLDGVRGSFAPGEVHADLVDAAFSMASGSGELAFEVG